MKLDQDELKDDASPDSGIWFRMRKFHLWMKGLEVDGLTRRRYYYGVVFYRFLVLMTLGTYNVALTRRASSLTFTTILAIFPLLAVATSTASLFFTEEKEEQFLSFIEDRFLPSATMSFAALEDADDAADAGEEIEKTEGSAQVSNAPPPLVAATPSLEGPPSPASLEMQQYIQDQEQWTQEIRGWVRSASNKFRSSAAGAGLFGFLGLLVTTGLLYYTIETTVNEVWHTEHMMSWLHTVRNFMTALVLAPIIIAISISSTAIIRSLFVSTTEDPATLLETIRFITAHFWFIVYLIPLTLVALILGMAYTFIPVAKVKFRYAFLGGLVASILWEVARNVFYFYITMSTVNSTLQDAFGLSIVFLIWLYVSWLILLLGHQVVYVSQNIALLWGEGTTREQTILDARMILVVMVVLARRFMGEGGGLTEFQIRRALGLGQKDLNVMLKRLSECGYITEIRDNGWQIAHPPDQIAISELLGSGLNLEELPIAREGKTLTSDIFHEIQERSLHSHGDETLAGLIQRVRVFRSATATEMLSTHQLAEEPQELKAAETSNH